MSVVVQLTDLGLAAGVGAVRADRGDATVVAVDFRCPVADRMRHVLDLLSPDEIETADYRGLIRAAPMLMSNLVPQQRQADSSLTA